MQFTTSKGIIKTFELDIDKILEMEASDPKYSIFAELDGLDSDNIRLTMFDHIARFVGSDLKQMIRDGIRIEDIATIFTECLKESGFISEEPASASSSDPDAFQRI